MKKVYSAASAFAHVVRAESVSEGFSGDALKLEGHTINGGKRGTLVRIEKKSTQNRMPREASLKGKLTTSVGNPVLEASVDCKGGCFEFGAIKRKIGNGDLPSAKRSIFKDERVNISNSPSNCESSQCTEAKKNNVNPRIIRPGSVRADNYIPSTTEPYDSIEDFTNRSFNGTNEMNFKHNKTARRALRFVEDDDGEQRRTPVHQVAAVPLLREYSGTFQSERKSHMQPESSRGSLQNASNSDMSIGFIGNVSSRVNERPINVTGNIEMMDSCYSASRLCNIEVNVLKYSADLLAGSNSVNQKKCITASPNGRAANNELETLDSPGNTDKLVNIEALKHQVRGEIPKNNQFGDPCKLFGTTRFSCSPLISQKHKSSLEKSRAITKSNLSGLSFAENRSNVHFSAECYTEKDVSGRQRSDITRDATSADSAESKLTGSAMSMKHLIAAAQAKRREAHSHQLLDGSGTPGSSLASKCVRGRSPNLMSTMQTLPSRGDPSQKDEKWFQTSVPCELPSTSHQNFPVKQRKHEGYDHRPSTGNLQPSDSSSHSTETAVARDALEGMIETLSRTRDSIGRATRHAIDCAKYGIAKEVVELLIHKLEGEPSLSHRIDLFFLVDSITQCSHTQKGIAGASYVPIVQEALPRLLGAAAPAGASAQENRRQCLKVLRLWLERRILPEYFLRHCMDEIEVRNDGLNFEFSSRIPSCASQCVDDPIREVESLFVDQYGSNTTFLFPGILSAQDLEGDEDFPSSPCNGTADCSPHEVGGVSEVLLGSEGRPMEAHHHALEHVENEIEMEDALTSPDERSIGRGSSYSFAHPQEHCSVVESTCGYQNELLLLPVGSPPLPLDPPPTPPLPPSPPPPTPPPPTSPPPMPPPQSPPIVPSPSPPQLPSRVHGMQFMHQVSYSSQLLQQCGETIRQIPPHSALPALKILNHPLPSIEMPSDHLYHGNSMCQHHLKQKYSHCPSSSEEQWMSHHGDANQDYSDAQNIGGRSPSCSSAPFVGDGCCRLNMARTAASTDFYHLQHYSAPSRASLPGDSFPNFTGIDFWRPT